MLVNHMDWDWKGSDMQHANDDRGDVRSDEDEIGQEDVGGDSSHPEWPWVRMLGGEG